MTLQITNNDYLTFKHHNDECLGYNKEYNLQN